MSKKRNQEQLFYLSPANHLNGVECYKCNEIVETERPELLGILNRIPPNAVTVQLAPFNKKYDEELYNHALVFKCPNEACGVINWKHLRKMYATILKIRFIAR